MPSDNQKNDQANQNKIVEEKKADKAEQKTQPKKTEKIQNKSQETQSSTKKPPEPTVKKEPPKVKKDPIKVEKKQSKAVKNGQKRSVSGFIWPILCSAAVAGGLITTQDMWVKKSDNNSQISEISEISQTTETNKTAIAQLVAQTGSLTEIKSQIQTLSTNDPKDLVAPLQTNIDTLQSRLDSDMAVLNKSLGTLQGDYARINAQTDGMISQMQAFSNIAAEGASPELQQRLDALEVARRQAVSALEAQVLELTQTLDDIKQQQPAFEIFDRRINDIENQVGANSTHLEGLQSNISSNAAAGAQFMALDNITRQIDLGQDYSDTLTTLMTKLPPQTAEAVTILQQNIGQLVPLYKLQADFNDISRQIIIAERKEQAKKAGDTKQGLLSSLNELVTITRNDGGAEGSADRLIYNIKQALQSGDLTTVDQLLTSASPQAQQAASSWHHQLKAKIGAEAALVDIRNSLSAAGE